MTIFTPCPSFKITGHLWLKLLLYSTLLFGLTACNNEVELESNPVRTVKIETVSANKPYSQRRFVGRIDAVKTVDLSFQVSGRLTKLPMQEGAIIPKGEVIARLDASDYQLRLQQAQAQFNLAQSDVTRKRNLFKSGSLPKALLDEAETNIKLQKVALKTAQKDFTYTKITAPFDALVTQRLLDEHTNVSAHQAVVRIQELSELRVRINIPEDMVKLLDKKDFFQATAIFKERPQQAFPLTYREHIAEANNVAQTYEVIFGLSREHNQHILPGMTVIVIIESKAEPSLDITVPVSAIDYDEQGKPRVWLFDSEKGTVSIQMVSIGMVKQHNILVLSGLKVGDEIVTAGAHLLHEGMTVRRFTSF